MLCYAMLCYVIWYYIILDYIIFTNLFSQLKLINVIENSNHAGVTDLRRLCIEFLHEHICLGQQLKLLPEDSLPSSQSLRDSVCEYEKSQLKLEMEN